MMATLKEIETAMAEAAGKALLDVMANPNPHEGDLPIRQHETGQIVTWIPREYADGARPVVLNGLVVGYYCDTENGRCHPFFVDGRFVGWLESQPRDLWMVVFNKDGTGGRNTLIGVEGSW